MAVVESAEREVVVLVGVPLGEVCEQQRRRKRIHIAGTYGISDGVSGFEPGWGMLI